MLGVPCLTLRDSTERPVTVSLGTNRLVPDRGRASILEVFGAAWGSPAEGRRPELWDGAAAERIVEGGLPPLLDSPRPLEPHRGDSSGGRDPSGGRGGVAAAPPRRAVR